MLRMPDDRGQANCIRPSNWTIARFRRTKRLHRARIYRVRDAVENYDQHGAVDRSYVLASRTLDEPLTYEATTRLRQHEAIPQRAGPAGAH